MLEMTSLSDEQMNFIKKNIKKSAKDIWEEELIKLRGFNIQDEITLEDIEKSISQWVLVETKDGGEGLRPYKCLCGRSIRYQFIVKHRTLDVTHKLGSECIKKYTGIDGKIAKKVLVEKREINSQVDEIIHKFNTYEIEKQLFLLDYEYLPHVKRRQIELGLPLTDSQLKKVFKLLDQSLMHNKQTSKGTYEILSNLQEKQLTFINGMSFEERQQLIVTLKDGRKVYTLDDLKKLATSEIALREKETIIPHVSKEKETVQIKSKSDKVKLIEKALKYLNNEQRQFWGTRMSLNQRIETAKYIIDRTNIVKPHRVKGMQIDNKLRQQIYLGIPLTEKQMKRIET